LWTNTVREINARERDCGLPLTTYEKGSRPEKAPSVISDEAKAKLTKYATLSKKVRLESIEKTEDAEFLRLIVDMEPEQKLKDEAVLRLAELRAV
jgi:hypothetical protein